MELVNESPFDVVLSRIDLDQSGLLAVLIIKSTFDLDEARETLSISAAPMQLVRQMLETPYGIFHSECFYKKAGIDLCVLGTVRRHAPVERAKVRVALGERAWELRVYGNRRWQRQASLSSELKLVPSRPEPFLELPLGYAHAFGGEVNVGDMPYRYPKNPKGRGFYRSAEEALEQLLPNIEDARGPEQTEFQVDKEPAVAGFGPYPQFWALRAEAGVQVNPETQRVASISPSLFNHAHPDLVLDAIPPATSIVVEGLSSERLVCPIPPPPARVEAQIGAQHLTLDAPIDGLFLWTDDKKLVVTQRARFKYEMRPEERRIVTVRSALPFGQGAGS